MKPVALAYFGTPEFSARFLQKFLDDKEIPVAVTLVVTQPDKKVGRKQILTPSPVKQVAEEANIPVYESAARAGGRTQPHQTLSHADLALVYAYGKLIPKDLLKAPKHGFWNIHPSLLPKYRGPSPTAYPLMLGKKKTGVSLMKMDEKMDHGPILAQEKFDIPPGMKRPELENALTELGYALFKKQISTAINQLQPIQQNHQHATYTRLLKKDHGYVRLSTLKKALRNNPLKESELPFLIRDYHRQNSLNEWMVDLQQSARLVHNYFRGLYPWPGAWTRVSLPQPPGLRNEAGKPRGLTKRLKLTDLSLTDNKLIINRVQLEGKKEVDFETFSKAYAVF